jgi:hypothetical protein
MGSLELAVANAPLVNRRFAKRVAEYQYTAEDGVEVLVSLNVDDHGFPFELDVWRTDFSASRPHGDS